MYLTQEAADGELRIDSADLLPPHEHRHPSFTSKERDAITLSARAADATTQVENPVAFPTPTFYGSPQCMHPRMLAMKLKNGVLKDSQYRIGYIASNQQFQFDSPPQHGAIYTGGFSLCDDASLALGRRNLWYACASGNFSNLYWQNVAPQCRPVYLRPVKVIDCSSGSGSLSQSTSQTITASPSVNSNSASPISQSTTMAAMAVRDTPTIWFPEGFPQFNEEQTQEFVEAMQNICPRREDGHKVKYHKPEWSFELSSDEKHALHKFIRKNERLLHSNNISMKCTSILFRLAVTSGSFTATNTTSNSSNSTVSEMAQDHT